MNDGRASTSLSSSRPRRPALPRALIALLALIAAVTGCRTRYADRPEVGTVAVYDVGGQVELSARRSRGKEKSKVGAPTYRTRDDVFREKLGLDTSGYVYHPNLVEFALAGAFGLVQRDFDSNFDPTNQEAREDNGTTTEFDLSSVFLKEKSYPTRLFARRTESLEPQAFRPSVERESMRYGLEWRYVSTKIPTRLLLTRSEQDYDQIGSIESDWSQDEDLLRFETGYNFSDNNSLQVSYEHREVEEDQELRGSFDYEIDEIRADHLFRFGGEPAHNLRSNITYYDQTGDFGVERFDWTEFLELKHLDNFETFYRGEFGDRTQQDASGGPDQEEVRWLLGTGLRHRLFQSLTTRASAEYEVQDFEGGPEIENTRVDAALDYRKKTGIGVLTSGVGAYLQETDNSGSERPLTVLDERQTFVDPNPIILTAPNILTASIVITNLQGTLTYTRGLDYTVLTFANRVEINRVVTGRILNGQTVLIDYQIAPTAGYVLDTSRAYYRVRHDFDFGLSPYYRFEWQGEDLSGDEENGPIPDDFKAHIIGTEFRYAFITALVEYEDHDSNISPYDAKRANLTLSHRFDFPATARLHGLWSDVDYEPPNDRETTTFDVGGTYRHDIANNLHIEARALYRYEDDTIRDISKGYDVYLEVEWRYRDFEFRMFWEMSRFSTDSDRTRDSMLYLQVIRSF